MRRHVVVGPILLVSLAVIATAASAQTATYHLHKEPSTTSGLSS